MQSKNTETDRKITHITFYLTRLLLGKKRCFAAGGFLLCSITWGMDLAFDVTVV